MNPLQQYKRGLRAGIPVIFGFVPVGIAYAIMAQQAGLTTAEIIFMSSTVFAGASQMMAVGMYLQGAGITTIILATFILNLRHMIMSTCVVNRMRREKLGRRLLASFGVTDESFAIFMAEKEENGTVYYFLGLITVTYSSWILGSAVGAVASAFLPAIFSASFGIALYAMFIGILLPNAKQNFRLGLLIVFTALANWLISQVIPSSWALIISTLLGAAVGIFFVDLREKEDASE